MPRPSIVLSLVLLSDRVGDLAEVDALADLVGVLLDALAEAVVMPPTVALGLAARRARSDRL